MLSQSLKGFALGGFVSGFGSPAFYGIKTQQKENASREVLWPPEALCGCEWHLQVIGWGILVSGFI